MKMDDIGDLTGQVPNLNSIQPYGEGGSPFFVLRGVTTTDYTFTQSSPIALYVDDAVRSLPVLEIGHMYDIERIEVLRGPQGSLYGKNATGGAVNIITKKPDFEQEGYVTLGYGNYDRKEAKAAYQNSLIDDVLAVRIAMNYVADDGLVENKLAGRDNDLGTEMLAGRLSLLYTPSADLEAVFRVYSHDNDTNPYSVFSEVVDTGLTGGLTREGLDFHESRSQRKDTRWKNTNTGFNLSLSWDLNEDYTLVSTTSFDKAVLDYSADDDGLEYALDETDLFAKNIKQTVQELRIVSDLDGQYNWIAGLQYTSDELDNSTIIYTLDDVALGADFEDILGLGLGGRGIHFGNSYHQERDSKALYISGDYELTSDITFSAGYRYSDDDVEVSNYDAAYGETTDAGERVLNFPTVSDAGLAKNYTNSSIELGLDWQANEDTLAYFSFSQGYRSGAINGQAFTDASEITAAEPEEIDAYEIGIKSELLDGNLILNAAVFHYNYENQQFVIAEPGGFLFPLRNAPESTVDGFEADMQFLAAENITISAGIGLLDAKYEKLILGGNSVKGNQMIGAPKKTGNIAVDWQITSTELGDLSLNVNGSYQSKVYFTPNENEALSQDAYVVANARLSLESGDYSVGLWANNMFDEEYFVYGLDLTSTYGANYFQRGAPQTYGIDFSYRF
tara:strand:+ start:16005 stop:18032 length:2028 start_codon:yes stop_codon:yes gene_type:complete